MDDFSKAAHFIPPPKRLSDSETAEILINRMIQIHDIPRDLVSDWVPQFISQVWKAFGKVF